MSKTWIVNGTTVGGFHVFVDDAAIDGYLAGDLWATVATNPTFGDFDIRRFGVVDALTALTSASALAGAGIA